MENYSTAKFTQLSPTEIREKTHDYYRDHIQGKSVFNSDRKIWITFNRDGRRKTAKNIISRQKAAIVEHLREILSKARLANFKPAKPSHVKNFGAVGFLNFSIKVKIDNKTVQVRIPVMQLKNLRFQYDLSYSNY